MPKRKTVIPSEVEVSHNLSPINYRTSGIIIVMQLHTHDIVQDASIDYEGENASYFQIKN